MLEHAFHKLYDNLDICKTNLFGFLKKISNALEVSFILSMIDECLMLVKNIYEDII